LIGLANSRRASVSTSSESALDDAMNATSWRNKVPMSLKAKALGQ
jgi:hypothetical protein